MTLCRYEKNPILTVKDVPFAVNSIFNAGAVKFDDQYLLLCRVEMPDGRSSFVIARSENGTDFKVDREPCLFPEDHGEWNEYTAWGIEDARITKIEDMYYIIYTGYSRHDPLVMLSKTADFKSFTVLGTLSEPSNKDAVLFPEKIGGYFWKIDRPSSGTNRNMWINRSPDLLHWGEYRCLIGSKPGTWEQSKIGASTPPVKTDDGWLMLYHGVRSFDGTYLYKQGVLLLENDKPWQVKGRSREPVLAPENLYERVGDVGNVVFSTGWIIEDDGKVNIYYSGADVNICLASSTIENLIKSCTGA